MPDVETRFPDRTLRPFGVLILGLLLSLPLAAPGRAQEADAMPPGRQAVRALLLYGGGEFSSFPPSHMNTLRRAPLTPSVRQAAPPRDRWLARDKALHVTFSALWTLSLQYALVNKANWSDRRALPVSAGVSGTIGLSKEWYDWRYSPTRYFSARDLVADAVGIALAAGFILL
ncbi:hypothetical protein AWN76_001185 [Rhodothermaceae bacterium RA]|nr:hypothetical protein AWN76_001185 [Rhodothermaceae bacterium RA]